MVRLKYLCNASGENGALKRAWILTLNNGYQSQCFEVTVYKTSTTFGFRGTRAGNKVPSDRLCKQTKNLVQSNKKKKTG